MHDRNFFVNSFTDKNFTCSLKITFYIEASLHVRAGNSRSI